MSTQLSLAAMNISDMSFGVDLTHLPSRQESLRTLSQQSLETPSASKRIPKELAEKALANEPFEDLPRIVQAYYSQTANGEGSSALGNVPKFYRESAENFLRANFGALTHVPEISFDISNFDPEKEAHAIKRAKDTYAKAQLLRQVGSFQEAYDAFQALRNVFGKTDKAGTYSLETVIPSRYLPELLLAAPVWFIASKGGPYQAESPEYETRLTHFCDIVGTQEFANIFQMYNLIPTRPISDFRGRDIIPLPFAELIRDTQSVFDFLVIATPYHDLASARWTTRWQRNIDPFLFGFLKQMPEYMFFLGRWSGNGLFPHIEEMIADTMNHIEQNAARLTVFTPKNSSSRWYNINGSPHTLSGISNNNEFPILSYADNLLRAYKEGKVFNFLRGELST